jgi:hypothetical protein
MNTQSTPDWSLLPRPLIFDIIKMSTELKRKPFDSVMEELKNVELPEWMSRSTNPHSSIVECVNDEDSVYSLREAWAGLLRLIPDEKLPLGVSLDHDGYEIDRSLIGHDCSFDSHPKILTQDLYNKGRLWINRVLYETEPEFDQRNPENNTDETWGWPGLGWSPYAWGFAGGVAR